MGDAEARDCSAWKMKLASTIESYRPPLKSKTSAYVVARIVPVASDDENSLVRVARAAHPIQTTASMRRSRAVRGRIMQMVSDDHFEAVIAEYIRANGVSRCPTACVSPTQGSVPATDRMALAEYALTRNRRTRTVGGTDSLFTRNLTLTSNSTTRRLNLPTRAERSS